MHDHNGLSARQKVLEHFNRTLVHSDGHEVRLIVSVPARAGDVHEDWQCECQINGLGSGKVRTVMGVDPIQAIMLALTYLSTTLYFSDEYKEGKITWEGGMSPSDLGLPIAENVKADVERLRAEVDSLHNAYGV